MTEICYKEKGGDVALSVVVLLSLLTRRSHISFHQKILATNVMVLDTLPLLNVNRENAIHRDSLRYVVV